MSDGDGTEDTSPTRMSAFPKTNSKSEIKVVMGYALKHFFVSVAAGEGSTSLNSFDAALCEAGLGDFNLIRVSSILPPRCMRIQRVDLPPGSLLPTAYAAYTSSVSGQIVSSCIGVGIPKYPEKSVGVIMETSGIGSLQDRYGIAKRMVEEAMRLRNVTLGEVLTEGIEAQVRNFTTVFACVALPPCDAKKNK